LASGGLYGKTRDVMMKKVNPKFAAVPLLFNITGSIHAFINVEGEIWREFIICMMLNWS